MGSAFILGFKLAHIHDIQVTSLHKGKSLKQSTKF